MNEADTRVCDIGIVGAGIMGGNLARNLVRGGRRVAVQDLDAAKVTALLEAPVGADDLVGTGSLAQLVDRLAVPRKILIMVPAGSPTDAVLDGLAALLEPGDIVMDGGNAHFADTRRRTELLAGKGLHFVGVGISGGEDGALRGPSIMVGGSQAAYRHVGPLLESIAAKVDGVPCCAHVGPDGAGHFVKMVHNGIEYAGMQLIAEAYQLLRDVAGLPARTVAAVFAEWNEGELESYLLRISADIAGHVDPLTGAPFLEVISDAADQLGTGRWTVQEACELDVPVSSISAAVSSRSLSKLGPLRSAIRPADDRPVQRWAAAEREDLVSKLRPTLYAATIVAYAQGFDLIRRASSVYGWDIDLAALALIWRDGCIIRARLLDAVRAALGGPEPLLAQDHFAGVLGAADDSWRDVVVAATRAGVPVPGLSAALSFVDALRAERLPTALVQAQRDYMGAHRYRRADRDGLFHTTWNGDHTEVRVDR
ncbi:NADP-dependent phosphogluconate dehydrogenase [Actinoplanes sp. NPDC049265]|uniref:NADP-dependent phosphogluconate dehydrogenase n=1 Tax=Actinoplanes sp. NPDC049265 TaxID=3363902 RepID=UPI003721D975